MYIHKSIVQLISLSLQSATRSMGRKSTEGDIFTRTQSAITLIYICVRYPNIISIFIKIMPFYDQSVVDDHTTTAIDLFR